ncbi:MAG: hypothetical protein M3P14_12780, partial [Chloroflexota bacterium]|nr:hypothetical protein [Chloroflexota bacterium]
MYIDSGVIPEGWIAASGHGEMIGDLVEELREEGAQRVRPKRLFEERVAAGLFGLSARAGDDAGGEGHD